jgi:hypothetical protein
MSIWDLNESAVAKKVLDDRKETDIGTVTRVVEHTEDEDASNFEVFVSLEGGNRVEKFVTVSFSKRDTIEVPSVGDTVICGRHCIGRISWGCIKKADHHSNSEHITASRPSREGRYE